MLTLATPIRTTLAVLGTAAVLAATALPGLAVTPTGSPAGNPVDVTERLRPGQVVPIAGLSDGGYSGDGGSALQARFSARLHLAVAADGSILVADTGNGRTRRIGPDGTVRTIYNGLQGASEADCGKEVNGWQWCPRRLPESVATGRDGAVYVVDTAVRKVTPDGQVHTVAGDGDLDEGKADGGPATKASIYRAEDVAIDRDGNVLVADSNNGRIRKIDGRGIVTTIAGGGKRPVPLAGEGRLRATDVRLYNPTSVAVDSKGTVYVTTENASAIYAVDPQGKLRVAAGTGREYDPKDGELVDGTPATAFPLDRFLRVAVDAKDNLYAVHQRGVLRIDTKGKVHTVARNVAGNLADLAVAPNGDVYVTDGSQIKLIAQAERTVPKVSARPVPQPADPWRGKRAGSIATVAGSSQERDEPGRMDTVAHQPAGVAADADGNTYVTLDGDNRVFKVDRSGRATTFAGTHAEGSGGDGGHATKAKLNRPVGLAIDGRGQLYVADSGNNRIRLVRRDGSITTVAGNGESSGLTERSGIEQNHKPATEVGLINPTGVAVDAKGNLFVADTGNSQVHRVDARTGVLDLLAGSGDSYFDGDSGPATKADLDHPRYLAVDRSGNVYVSDDHFQSIRRIGADGMIRTIAGTGDHTIDTGAFSGDGGRADRAQLNTPKGLAVDAQGNLYVADSWNNRIRRIGRDGVITTVAGTGELGFSGDGKPARRAQFGEPGELAIRPDGELVVADVRNGRIRALKPGGTVSLVADLQTSAARIPAGQVRLSTPSRLTVAPDGRLVVRDGPWVSPFEVSARGTYEVPSLFSGELSGPVIGEVAYVGGEAYVLRDGLLSHVEADGRMVRIAGGGRLPPPAKGKQQAASRTNLSNAGDLTGSGANLYLTDLETRALYRITADGLIQFVSAMSKQYVWDAFAVDSNANVYRSDPYGVIRIDPGGEQTYVAGQSEADRDDKRDEESEGIGDGGEATDAQVGQPRSLAVDRDGTLYLSEDSGIRRVSPDGTIMTVVRRAPDERYYTSSTSSPAAAGKAYQPDAIALDQHGNLYFVDTETKQVYVVVRPGELEAPSRSRPWLLGAAIGGPAVLLLAVGAVVVVRRKRRPDPGETLTA